ncbi:MAG: ABC transporter ATP-binding protein [Eubacteriales bacterium]
MKYIINYLKPFLSGVLMAIVLLFIQSISDLNLPNYMSDIVNIGIQQSGIEHSTPTVISAQSYDLISTFMTKEEVSLLSSHYELIDGSLVQELYPNYGGEQLYQIKTSSMEDSLQEELNNAFSYASWGMISFLQELQENTLSLDGTNTEESITEPSSDTIQMAQLYQVAPLIQSIPKEQLTLTIENSRTVDILFASQTGILFAGAYYDELGIDRNDMQQDYIIQVGLFMLLIALIGGVATILVSLLTSRIAAGVARNLREQLFNKINSFSNEEYDRFSTSSLITRSTNDVQQIQMLCMMGIRFLFYAPIMLIGGVYMSISKSPSMAWVIGLVCILIIGFVCTVTLYVMPKFQAMQALIDRINLVARESLNGLMVIKAFGTDSYEKKRFYEANQTYATNNLIVNKAMAGMMPFMMLIMNLTSVLIVWVGAGQIAEATMQVGDMMAFIQYAMQIIMSFLMIGMMFVFIPRAIVSAQRINEILTTEAVITDPACPKESIVKQKGIVEFQNVSFTYAEASEPALQNISFTAKPGQTVAFIGATGSGKTTLVNLIPRFYDATKGTVFVDGVNVKELSQHDLHSKIGYVPQKSILMSGTIASNIKYGKQDLTKEELERAAQISQSLDFILEKENGYGSHVSQGGSNVSGGQRQRLSIARALAIAPQIYLFDDSFSALDYKTDVTLRTALKQQVSDATVIIIAQRVGTILDADVIHVLDKGQIIGSGTHKELLNSCEAYYEIASTQLSKEELEHA